MNSNHPDDPGTFLHHEARLAWTDFERIKYLRAFAASIQARLDELYRHPWRNSELIVRERIALEAVEQELRQLDPVHCFF